MSTSVPSRRFKRQEMGRPRGGTKKRMKTLEQAAQHFDITNDAVAGFNWSDGHDVVPYTFATPATVGLENMIKIRFTDIPFGATDESRTGHHVNFKYIIGEIMLVWVGLLPLANVVDYNPYKQCQVRIMIIQVFDEANLTTTFNTPPTIPDMFQNFNAALGVAAGESARQSWESFNGKFKKKVPFFTQDATAVDQQLNRQREFKVWYDSKHVLTWDGRNTPIASTVPSSTGGTSAAGSILRLEGLHLHTTDAEDGGFSVVEANTAKKLVVPIRVRMNTPVNYLAEDAQGISAVRGNIYLYMYSDHTLTSMPNLTAANWPTANGGATTNYTRKPQVFMRFRFKTFWQDT